MPDTNPNVAAPLAERSATDLQPVHQADAPVVIDRRPQVVHIDDNKINAEPQIVDGRVRASDDVSAQAVEQGYEPDIQPKAAAPGVALASGVTDTALVASGAVAGLGAVVQDDTAGTIKQLQAEGKDAEVEELANEAIAKKEAFERITSPLSMRSEQMVQDAKGELPDLAVVEGAPGSVQEQQKVVDEQKAAQEQAAADKPTTTTNDAEILPPQSTTDPRDPASSPTGPVETPIQNRPLPNAPDTP